MGIAQTIMESIEEELKELMCDGCPYIDHTTATHYDPPWDECPGDDTPADPGCRKHDEYLQVAKLAEQMEKLIIGITNCRGVRV